MTIEFDMTLLDLDGVATPDAVTRAEVDALVAYSTAVSLKRIADLLDKMGSAPMALAPAPLEVNGEPMISIKRGTKAAGAAPKVAGGTAEVKIPADFKPWGGVPQIVTGDGGTKAVGPLDVLADVIVFYRRGKSSKKLSAGMVNWAWARNPETGELTYGPDDVVAYHSITDPETGQPAKYDGRGGSGES